MAEGTKKSVAMSGVVAGRTAICAVGREGKGLIYRGYDIHDLAEHATFDEVAHLLLYGALPTRQQLDEFRAASSKTAPSRSAAAHARNAPADGTPDGRVPHGVLVHRLRRAGRGSAGAATAHRRAAARGDARRR